MIRYFLEECSRRFRPNEIKNFKAGDTFFNEHGDIYNETIASFDSKEEALEALRSYRSFVREDTYAVRTFEVTEYGVCESSVDDDGEEDFNHVEYIAFTPSPFTSED